MPDIHHAIRAAAPGEAVIDHVSTAGGLRQWWAEDVTSEADGRVSLGFFNRATVYRLRLLKRGPDGVSWRCESGDEWHDTELRFVSCNTTWGERSAAAGSSHRRRPGRRDTSGGSGGAPEWR